MEFYQSIRVKLQVKANVIAVVIEIVMIRLKVIEAGIVTLIVIIMRTSGLGDRGILKTRTRNEKQQKKRREKCARKIRPPH